MRIQLASCLGLSVLSLAAMPLAQAPVTFQMLDTVVAPGSTALGVSEDGSTVIGTFVFNTQFTHGYRLPLGHPFDDLGVLPNHNNSDATAVSADGNVVVGNSVYYTPIWTLPAEATKSAGGTGYVTLGYLAGDNSSAATGIDASGNAVVGQSAGGPNGPSPVVWLNSVPFALSHLNLTSTELPVAIDDLGARVIGNARTGGISRAVMWSGSGLANVVELPALPGFTETVALAISSDGNTVIGRSSVGNLVRNVRWTNGVPAELEQPLFPNSGTQWNILCANGDCTLLGGTGTFSPTPYTPVALLYKEGRGWIDVHDLLSRLGVNLGGLTLMSITGISNDGATIVGQASNSQYYLLRNLPLDGFNERLDGCGVGVSIYHYGRPVRGQLFGINITTPGPGVILAGSRVTIPFPGCPSCLIGAVDFSFGTNSLQLTVPNNPAMVGMQLTFQGVGFGGWVPYPCTGDIKLTRAVDVTIL